MMTKIIVAGAGGKMGQRICANALASDKIQLVGAIERSGHPQSGTDIGLICGWGKQTGILLSENLDTLLPQADVLIEFTNPAITIAHLESVVKHGKAMVIGTTGLNDAELAAVQKLGSQIPCVLSPNMSLGVNLLFKMAAEAARILGDGYDIEIVETHHRLKKDAPSGTAVKLADVIANAVNRDMKKVGCYGREGITGERDKQTIGVLAVRGGDIIGDHTVMYLGTGEKVELSHRATSRDTFAAGALRAALFVAKQSPKIYDMQDVLGLK